MGYSDAGLNGVAFLGAYDLHTRFGLTFGYHSALYSFEGIQGKFRLCGGVRISLVLGTLSVFWRFYQIGESLAHFVGAV